MPQWIDNLVDNLAYKIASYLNDDRAKELTRGVNYFKGGHPKTLKVKYGGADDNISLNFTALAIWRSVSRMLRGGVRFELPEGAEKQSEHLDRLWDANKQQIFLLRCALNAAVYGTGYIQVVPGGITDPYTGNPIDRLVCLNSEYVRVEVSPDDVERLERYIVEYEANGNGYRKIERRAMPGDLPGVDGEPLMDISGWIIEYYTRHGNYAKWELEGIEHWPFDFPDIIHWSNLPAVPNSAYGLPDIDASLLNLQDKVNFSHSNLMKIIRNQAHKQRYFTGIGSRDIGRQTMGIDTVPSLPEGATLEQLDADADLSDAHEFTTSLRQALFDISREVDISSITDKTGSLTNFGLRVLFTDATDKNDSKRQLFGDMLLELQRRLLVIAGFEGEQANPGRVVWSDPLPVNRREELEADKIAVEMGIVSKQTISEKHGYEWENEQARMAEGESNIGAAILRAFQRGEGA